MALQKREVSKIKLLFDRFSTSVTRVTGRPIAFISAVTLVLLWACSRPLFPRGAAGESAWELIINTGTTIITFLMVFVIQQSQNKDTVALHLKLNELIAASKAASNRLIDIEDLTEDELAALKTFYVKLSEMAEEDAELFTTHSIDEARVNHQGKLRGKPMLTEAPGRLHAESGKTEHFDERNDELPDSIHG